MGPPPAALPCCCFSCLLFSHRGYEPMISRRVGKSDGSVSKSSFSVTICLPFHFPTTNKPTSNLTNLQTLFTAVGQSAQTKAGGRCGGVRGAGATRTDAIRPPPSASAVQAPLQISSHMAPFICPCLFGIQWPSRLPPCPVSVPPHRPKRPAHRRSDLAA